MKKENCSQTIENVFMEGLYCFMNGWVLNSVAWDVDLGNGKLQQLRSEYENWLQVFIALSKARSRNVLEDALQIKLDEMNADKSFLLNGLSVAIEDYRKQFNSDSTSEEALKNANWEVTEYQNLIQQAQSIPATLETVLATLNPAICINRIFQRAIITLITLSEEPFQKETNLCIPYPGFHAV